ncbi:MAG: sigma-54 dependent transcriptional regulator [Pseudomonadota bacterium]
MTRSILVIDDNEGVRTALSVLFAVHDLPCVTADSVASGLAMLASHDIGLVIQDMNFTEDTTSGKEGEALFQQLRELDPDLPIILLTAWTHLEAAVRLVRDGAADYLSKPWDDDKLLATVQNLLELGDATRRVQAADQSRRRELERLHERFDLQGTVFASSEMAALIGIAVKVAPADVPVLITGPNGAGKEKIADIIHHNSAVRGGPLVKVNVGALPDQLIESELFGAEAGAYTGATKRRIGHFESADGGTLFLDEIGNLNLDGQAKLLRVLQTGEFQRLGSSTTQATHVRVVSATNADLAAEVAAGRFREDLYYRLNVIELELEPLKQRRDDILPLAYHFLGDDLVLTADAESALLAHDWSGNVRELENTIRRARLLVSGDRIDREDLALPAPSATSTAPLAANAGALDRVAIESALARAGGIVAQAARELGLSRQALYRRMEKHGIQKP